MDNTLTKPKNLAQQLENERNNYRLAFEQDKPFCIVKTIQLRIRQLEQQVKSVFSN